MNKTLCGLLAVSLMACGLVNAQDVKTSKAGSDKKEIVIEERSSGKNEKMVIVVDGDKITINGRPAEEYRGKKRIVIDDDIAINGNEVRIPRAGNIYFHGFENRPMLGVVTEKNDKGALVKDVIDESAADKAGIKEGDIITGLNGAEIKSHEDLVKNIEKLKPEDKADITYLRDGKQKKVKATLGKSKSPMAMAWNMDNKNHNYNFHFEPPMAMAGRLAPMAPFRFNDNDMWIFRDDRPRYGMSIEDNADGDGVKITGVDSAGNAMKAGIKEGDIITEVEGKTIKGTDELKEALGDVEDKSTITVKLQRNGATETVTVRVPKVIKKADL